MRGVSLDRYFKLKKNVTFECYEFKQLIQQRGETAEEIKDNFITSCLSLKSKCNY